MIQSLSNEFVSARETDVRWKDLYRIGAIACIALPVAILLAILAYFIWPYKLGGAPVADIFVVLQKNRLGGLMSLELQMLLIQPISLLISLAIYAALKRVNESYALIALVFYLMGILLMFMARPVTELVYLSNQYAAASSDLARSQYLAAGEAYLALYEGTAWMWSLILICISGIISSLLMLKSNNFTKATAYVGFFISVLGLGFLIPLIGALLALLSTVGGMVWYPLLARDFYRLGWGSTQGEFLDAIQNR